MSALLARTAEGLARCRASVRARLRAGIPPVRTVLLWIPVLVLLMVPGTFVLLPAAAWVWRRWKRARAQPAPGQPPTPA